MPPHRSLLAALGSARALAVLLATVGTLSAQNFNDDLGKIWASYSGGQYEKTTQAIRAFLDNEQYANDPFFAVTVRRLHYLDALSKVRTENWAPAATAIFAFEGSPGPSQPAWDEELLFRKGIALLKTEQFSEANQALTDFPTRYASSPKAISAGLLAGTALKRRGQLLLFAIARFSGRVRVKISLHLSVISPPVQHRASSFRSNCPARWTNKIRRASALGTLKDRVGYFKTNCVVAP
jgi:hypothetical protein